MHIRDDGAATTTGTVPHGSTLETSDSSLICPPLNGDEYIMSRVTVAMHFAACYFVGNRCMVMILNGRWSNNLFSGG